MTASATAAASPLPTQMKVGEEARAWIDGGEVVIIGSAPRGLPVVLTPDQWATLCRWKINQLRIANGRVRACGIGRSSGPHAANFLVGIDSNRSSLTVVYRNGNPFDLRGPNLAVVPRSLLAHAKEQAARKAAGERVWRVNRRALPALERLNNVYKQPERNE